MKKLLTLSVISSVLMMTGCGTYRVSNDIAVDGSSAGELIFPPMEDAWKSEGTFPNIENLTKIDKNMTKDDLYHLIGSPHFKENQHAREWDYIFKFRNMKTRDYTICQYKVLFDENMMAQSYYWLPESCAQNVKPPEPKVIVKQVPAPAPQKIQQERITLGADALFQFNKHQVNNILPMGKEKLRKVSQQLTQLDRMGKLINVRVTGHTDRLGSDMYNQDLSRKRAQTVKSYLMSMGVNGSKMYAVGRGESEPVKQCGSMPRNALINCLQPNRRVTLDISYIK